MSKQFYAEFSVESVDGKGWYYAELDMPATDYEIRDALQKLRLLPERKAPLDISIYNCDLLSELDNIRLDTTSIEELNFFAKRLDSLEDYQRDVFVAAVSRVLPDNIEEELVSIKDLINSTYGLDNVSVISNVGNDTALGEFVIENKLQPDVAAVPEGSEYLLDKATIGKLQREIDGGVFVNNRYILLSEYKMPEVYDGRKLPEQEEKTDWVFRLKIAESPVNSADETEGSAEWLTLPTQKVEADRIARMHNEGCIEDCVYLDFISVIPQINSEQFGNMEDFDKINSLAWKIKLLSLYDQIKFKAVLEAEQPQTIDGIKDIADHLWKYEMYASPHNSDAFFKDYLGYHMGSQFDSRWLDTLLTQNEGNRLVGRLGAYVSDYGVVSARGMALYDLVPYDDPSPSKELTTQSLTDEKLDVIEVLDRKALFSNGRIMPDEVPAGLYAYDLRMNDDQERFASIEPKVMVNHGGTVLMAEPLNFGDKDCILLSEDDEPNFLGEEMTVDEFLEDVEESEAPTMSM